MAIATEKATILMRHGLKKDFDPDQMTAGEWAVSIDTVKENQIVWMCFVPGVVKRMGTYEDFYAQIEEATGDIREQYISTFNEIKAAMEQLKMQTEDFKDTASAKATEAATSATTAGQEATAAAGSASTAATKATEASQSADDAQDYATEAESYAHGGTGTRPGEDADNAKKYYEQARDVSQGLTGALKPMGTVTFASLPALSSAITGGMYNISDAFTTTTDFKEGAGHAIPAGANVYKTTDGKWDVLAGTPVASVNGKTGEVVLSADDVGALSTNGGIVNGDIQVNSINYSKSGTVINETGWYRAFVSSIPSSRGNVVRMDITRSFGNTNNESYCININIKYKHATFFLCGAVRLANNITIDKIRFYYNLDDNGDTNGIDIHVTTDINNTYKVYGSGTGKFEELLEKVEDNEENYMYVNFDLSNTIKSSTGFYATDTHALLGTAGADSTVQALIDAVADRVINKLYRLEGGTIISENADMNDEKYRVVGNYYCNGDAIAVTIKNLPLTNKEGFILKVDNPLGAGLYIRQTFINWKRQEVVRRAYDPYTQAWHDNVSILKNSDIINTLASTATDKPLSANMGKTLDGKISELNKELGECLLKNGETQFFNSVSDLNYFYTGIGLFNTDTLNLPTSSDTWYIVISAGLEGTVAQRAYGLMYGDSFFRKCTAGNWLTWDNKNFATESYVDNKIQAITATANSDWISWGELTGFSIMGKFFLSCPEFQFAKSESFGNGDNALLWTLSVNTGIYGRVFYVHTSSRMVRLRIDGNTIRGHYDTPPTGDVFTINEFFG